MLAFVIGDRGEQTSRCLLEAIPAEYRLGRSVSDFWEADRAVFPKERHRPVDERSGELAHIERWFQTLRQNWARYVRKTQSFSQSNCFPEAVTCWFIGEYNREVAIRY